MISGTNWSQGVYNYSSSITGNDWSQGNYNRGCTIIGTGWSLENGNYLCAITGSYWSIGNYNYSFRTGLNFNYHVIGNFIVPSKNVSAIAEFHGKTYEHKWTKNTANAVYAVHLVGTTPTYTAAP